MINKLFYTTLGLTCTIVAAMYISLLLGNQYFILGTLALENARTFYAVSALIFLLPFSFMLSIVCALPPQRILIFALGYLPVYLVGAVFFNNGLLTSLLLPTIYIFATAWRRNTLNLRVTAIYAFFALFTLALSFVRTNVLFVGFEAIAVTTAIILTVDPLLLLLILYGKEVSRYDRMALEIPFPIDPASEREVPGDSEAIAQLNALTSWQRTIAVCVWFGQQILACIFVLLVAHFIGNVLVEALIVIATFVAYGYHIRYRWHHKACTLVSTGLFFVAARTTPPLYISHMIPIIIGFLLVYGAYRLAILSDRKHYLESRWSQAHVFRLTKYCDQNKLKENAEAKGLNPKQIQLLILYYSEGANWARINSAFAPWSESTIRKYLKSATAQFNA